jgi:hypothetical protein
MHAIERTSPIALYNFGISYLDTARLAWQSQNQPMFSDPIEFLCAHGLELIFKAELCRSSDIVTVRRKYGHDIIKLRKKLGAEFLAKFPIDNACDNVINYLAIGHSGPNWRNRYIVTGARQHLSPSQILPPLAAFDTSNRHWLTGHFKKAHS